jgi:hypothetical protein
MAESNGISCSRPLIVSKIKEARKMKTYISPLAYSGIIIAIIETFVSISIYGTVNILMITGFVALIVFYVLEIQPSARPMWISSLVKDGAQVKVVSILDKDIVMRHEIVVVIKVEGKLLLVTAINGNTSHLREGYLCIVQGDILVSAK